MLYFLCVCFAKLTPRFIFFEYFVNAAGRIVIDSFFSIKPRYCNFLSFVILFFLDQI
ncbi:hypothetical protein NEIELOOT_03109 [Neisseria elongata subsp. glycolytica ATCC 29315]|uniref:Uncharacterized protein n=1 Tax=Neisseria elongata subsp. glycolytica ATCC 29315 TaxID=546263 RepID=D4DVJ2_NEIEG|nr:hypothetical protein NEIELOOT_03109 [Neisseria elongata subsp. glycolytica ATCC 29315]